MFYRGHLEGRHPRRRRLRRTTIPGDQRPGTGPAPWP